MSADPGKTRPFTGAPVSLHVTVLGTGTMGQGIAQVCAQSGHTTRLFDAVEGRALGAVKGIGAQLEKLLGKGKITGDQRHQAMNRLSAATDAKDACSGADIVIEAVPEDMTLKLDVVKPLLDVLGPHALIGTNTSSLSITELGARLGVPERTVGLHFFNPPPVMELVEVVRGLSTSDATIARAVDFAKGLGVGEVLLQPGDHISVVANDV